VLVLPVAQNPAALYPAYSLPFMMCLPTSRVFLHVLFCQVYGVYWIVVAATLLLFWGKRPSWVFGHYCLVITRFTAGFF